MGNSIFQIRIRQVKPESASHEIAEGRIAAYILYFVPSGIDLHNAHRNRIEGVFRHAVIHFGQEGQVEEVHPSDALKVIRFLWVFSWYQCVALAQRLERFK